MRVGIIGAGLQGSCLAMELTTAGVQVDLYDRSDDLLAHASSCNEGKLHLGYVYAHDHSLATARLMVRGATTFAPLLRRWIGGGLDALQMSAPFHYAVHRGSLLSADEIEEHLRLCQEIACEFSAGEPDYFGGDYREPAVRLREHPSYDGRNVAAIFRTSETAVDPEALARLIRKRIAGESNIQVIMGAEVERVSRAGEYLDVHFSKTGSAFVERYEHVINAAWGGRLALDATLGIAPPQPWLFRFKCYARVSMPAGSQPRLPSTTVVLGPYGDIVDYRNGDYYLSWYPASLIGRSSEMAPPAWSASFSQEAANNMFRAIQSGLASIVPDVAKLKFERLRSENVRGGVIFAWGRTDIDDPLSQLHERVNIGPQHYGRYHSIDTGKLTMAPLFAKMTADRILGS